MVSTPSPQPFKRTPLYALHLSLGAKMVPFAGYEMPVQYPSGILAEHLHTRKSAGLFDVSHMGQVRVTGKDAAAAFERLVPADIVGLAPLRQRYSQFTNAAGGILDDLMTTRLEDGLFVVVNAACKDDDLAHMRASLAGTASLEPLAERALLALQGPAAVDVLARLAPECRGQSFMSLARYRLDGVEALVTRSGYTGEDGFELSLPADAAERLAQRLLAEPEVKPIGLGARDSLRLEAGLCLYGHDIDKTTTPVEAGLAWSIGKRRRAEGGFPGAEIIRAQLAEGTVRRRVGILPEGKAPAREGTEIVDAAGGRIGFVTAGGFAPSRGGPIAQGYVERTFAKEGMPLALVVRGVPRPAKVAVLPFVPHRYHRG
ncbi:MAG: glycine cleavage system aminomethyltransferase GcvT [Alphaproteobacteria bacterium]